MISQEQIIGDGDLHVRRETLSHGRLTWRMQRNLWVFQSFQPSMLDIFQQVIPVEFISMEQHIQESIYVINCIWELFVVVGKNARGHRERIRWAVEISKVTPTRFFYLSFEPTTSLSRSYHQKLPQRGPTHRLCTSSFYHHNCRSTFG